ncbi:MAG: GGDEF domain-containing protein [Pseudomonadota bacterium]
MQVPTFRRQLRVRHTPGGAPASLQRLLWALAVLCAALMTATPVRAAGAERQVLVLYSLGSDSASEWQNLLHRGLFDELNQAGWGAYPGIFEERLDALRVGEQEATASMGPYLQSKYANVALDAVISENFQAARFLSSHPELFPGVPRYYVNHGRPGWQPSDGLGIAVTPDFERALGAIALTMPHIERVVVVGDRSERGREWVGAVRAAMPRQTRGIRFEVWDDQSFEQLYRRAGTLDARSAIYLLPTYGDSTGARSLPTDVARTLAASTAAPIFTLFESLILPGILGGYVTSADQVGHLIGRLMLQQRADPVKVQAYMFDYALARQFDLRDLPEQTVFLRRPQGLWQLHRWQLVGAISLISLEALLIWALVLALRGRRQTLDTLHLERSTLEQRVAHRTLELLMANDKLAHLATTDALTGIGNRRKMTQQIAHELERVRRFDHPLALLMVDIDHFKRINDAHGHDAGDRAIVAVTEALTGSMRAIDFASRFGGEEFVLLMPETELAVAALAAERLRAAVAALRVPLGDGQHVRLTISIGVAACPGADSDDTPGALLMRADKALYRAKQAGRDRVLCQ